jgi:hypothetical protein
MHSRSFPAFSPLLELHTQNAFFPQDKHETESRPKGHKDLYRSSGAEIGTETKPNKTHNGRPTYDGMLCQAEQ